ncbi:MAG: FAD-dependent thymidylate synthase [Spirochaetota bacterium]
MEILNSDVVLLAITPDAEKIIEEAGRTCYLSFDRMDDGSAASFIPKAIQRGHHSILEHASATFRIKGASRAFTHQLVRHRLASFSQQSQRYVKEDEFDYIMPPSIAADASACEEFRSCMEQCRQSYLRLRQMSVLKEDARFVLPNALESEIVFTANFRELRHLLEIRLEPHAQWEIRRVCMAMLLILQKEAPSVFGDFEIIDKDNWIAKIK